MSISLWFKACSSMDIFCKYPPQHQVFFAQYWTRNWFELFQKFERKKGHPWSYLHVSAPRMYSIMSAYIVLLRGFSALSYSLFGMRQFERSQSLAWTKEGYLYLLSIENTTKSACSLIQAFFFWGIVSKTALMEDNLSQNITYWSLYIIFMNIRKVLAKRSA